MRQLRIQWLAPLLLLAAPAGAQKETAMDSERMIRKAVVVNASLDEVWLAWTTNDGAQAFFAPATNIDATLGGHYEIYFFPQNPYGKRGAEGCRVHSVVPKRSLAFTWNAPPSVPDIRNADLHTLVIVRFESLGPRQTRVLLTQLGWGEGESWDKTYAYFVSAWDIVLGRLKLRFESGPLDWSNPPRPTESLELR